MLPKTLYPQENHCFDADLSFAPAQHCHNKLLRNQMRGKSLHGLSSAKNLVVGKCLPEMKSEGLL